MVASKDKTLQGANVLATGLKGVPQLLPAAAVYGANASGKSNLIKALQYMRGVVVDSAAMAPNQTFAVQPFRLHREFLNEPTEFEISFILDKTRYQYGFALTSRRITSEYLLVYRSFKPQRWFSRSFDEKSGKDIYEFSASLKGFKNLWEKATRSNSLFLSMAAYLNSEALQPVFDWFANQLIVFNEFAAPNPDLTVQMLEDADNRKNICNFLASADISIADIEVETRMVPGGRFRVDFLTGKAESQSEESEQKLLRFHHITKEGSAIFDLIDESSGTRNLLFLLGPIFKTLQKGLTLVIDELDVSLHPLLVAELISLFHNRKANQNKAQLIFTSHNTSFLNVPQLLRRDQVWFVEKGQNQASVLTGLQEFSPRKHEAIERGYLMGRYGAIPLFDRTTVAY